ncbi:hypothetical protein Bca4012_005838 [Brassica carinata]
MWYPWWVLHVSLRQGRLLEYVLTRLGKEVALSMLCTERLLESMLRHVTPYEESEDDVRALTKKNNGDIWKITRGWFGQCFVYLTAILGRDGPNPCHKCDWKCENENVCGNMYRCKLTGLNHVCDKNCNQRILYENHNSLCRASGRIFPLSPAEEQAVKGVRRKLDDESQPSESCVKRRRRDAQFHSSPFERSFAAVSPICSQAGDGMELN